ncbi:MAG TPA: CoA transferase [Mycobacteriales bacterium]|nr:CoA transferase [Mycobacteriales bacterium]
MTAAGPLEGTLVVDLSRVLAGPFCTMLMADLGARVIKVEKPGTGDDSRSYGPFLRGESLYFARLNRGKESVAVDLKDEAGRALLRRIVAQADVLVENYRPGVMERLGLSYTDLSAVNPRLVYVSVSGFGQTGPWRSRPAYDAVVQGLAGTIAITGRPGETPVKPGVPLADLSAGLYAFGGACAAMLAARATGQGTHLDVAMYDASVSLLEGAALRYLATGDDPPLIGNAHHAIAPFDTYATADGVITVCAANDALWGALCAAIGAPELLTDQRYASNALRHDHLDDLRDDLEKRLRSRRTDEWLGVLTAAGVPCGTVAGVGEAVTSEQAVARRMVIEAGGLPVPGQALKMSAYPDPLQRPAAPVLDADGEAVRAEFAAD